MKKLYSLFKKAIGVSAYLYWMPFFYGVKNGHVLPGMGEVSSTILLFCIGIFLSMGFLGMCKHNPIDKDALRLQELYVEEIPNDLRVITTWLGQVVIGILPGTPMQVWLITGVLFVLLWKINWWIYNPIFMIWSIRFCKVRLVRSHENFYFMMPVQLKNTHRQEYIHFDNYNICMYNGKLDWIAFKRSNRY